MVNDDYFKIVYLILSELYNAMKKGREVDFKSISKKYFNIPESVERYSLFGGSFNNMI